MGVTLISMKADADVPPPLPVTIIGGYLGAGKTTLLNRILQAPHGRRLAVLVNDFGDLNIDADLVERADADTIALANGCICCSIRSDLKLTALRLLETDPRPEGVLVEASGVSDPIAVAETFLQDDLARSYRTESILMLVDTANLPGLDFDETERIVDQTAVADIVLLNKTDLAGPGGTAKVRDMLREAVPHARLLETVQAELPGELLPAFEPVTSGGNPLRKRTHTGHGDPATRFETWSWSSATPLSLDAFRDLIPTLPPTIYRGKGILRFFEQPETRTVFQLVGKRSELEASGTWPESETSRLVLIGTRGTLDPAALTTAFEGCVTAKTP